MHKHKRLRIVVDLSQADSELAPCSVKLLEDMQNRLFLLELLYLDGSAVILYGGLRITIK